MLCDDPLNDLKLCTLWHSLTPPRAPQSALSTPFSTLLAVKVDKKHHCTPLLGLPILRLNADYGSMKAAQARQLCYEV